MAAPAVSLDTPPVIDSLKDVLAIFGYLQLNHHQPAIVTQGQQVDWSRARRTAVRCPKLRVQRSNNQSRIELRDIAAQDRFEPGLTRGAVQPVTPVATVFIAVGFQILK